MLVLSILLLLLNEQFYIFSLADNVQNNNRLQSRSGYKPTRGHSSGSYKHFKTEISISPGTIMLRCKIQEPLEHIVWVLSKCPSGHGGYGDKLIAEGATVHEKSEYDLRLLGANSTITSELLIKNPLSKDGSGVYRCEAWPHGGGGAPYGQYVAQDVYIIGGKEMLKGCFGGWESSIQTPSYDFGSFAKTAQQRSDLNSKQATAPMYHNRQQQQQPEIRMQPALPSNRRYQYVVSPRPKTQLHQQQQENEEIEESTTTTTTTTTSPDLSSAKPPMLIFAQGDGLQKLMQRYKEFLRQKDDQETVTALPPKSYVAPVTEPSWSELMIQSRASKALYGNGNNGVIVNK